MSASGKGTPCGLRDTACSQWLKTLDKYRYNDLVSFQFYQQVTASLRWPCLRHGVTLHTLFKVLLFEIMENLARLFLLLKLLMCKYYAGTSLHLYDIGNKHSLPQSRSQRNMENWWANFMKIPVFSVTWAWPSYFCCVNKNNLAKLMIAKRRIKKKTSF